MVNSASGIQRFITHNLNLALRVVTGTTLMLTESRRLVKLSMVPCRWVAGENETTEQ